MEASLCGERISSGSLDTQRHCCLIDKDKDIQRRHDEHENNEINRLDKLGNTSRHCRRRVADVVGCL